MSELHRIYQGRVIGGVDEGGEALDEEAAGALLWRHHELFHQAVNYYLLALASLESREGTPVASLKSRMAEVWEEWTDRRGVRRPGLKDLAATPLAWLCGCPARTLEEALDGFGTRFPVPVKARTAILDLLLAKCQGDGGIKQGGRDYWPRLCDEGWGGTPDFSPSTFASKEGQAQLRDLLHGSATQQDLERMAFRMDLTWAGVKVDSSKGLLPPEAARGKLKEAVEFFEAADAQGAPADQKALLQAAPAAWAEVKEHLAQLSDEELRIPVNRKANPSLTMAARLFMHSPCELTRGLLALCTPKPKHPTAVDGATGAKKLKKQMKEEDSLLASAEEAALALGEDPIVLGRGRRGFVFPAFTALDPWGARAPETPMWKEFDIAAFKEALKTLNQIRLKTKERKEEQARLQKVVNYMLGQGHDLKGTPYGEDGDLDSPGILAGDPRLSRLEDILNNDLAVFNEFTEGEGVAYSLRRRTLRGLDQLCPQWERVLKAGNPTSPEALEAQLVEVLNEFQSAHPDSVGSATFMRALCRPENWIIWREAIPADAPEDASEHFLSDYLRLQEHKADIERLKEPVRFTPADPVNSRRQYLFSDIPGSQGIKFLPGGQQVEVSIIVAETGGTLAVRRLALAFSAPRLLRDDLDPVVCAAGGGPWAPPMVIALGVGEEGQPSMQKSPALALMPDMDRQGHRRFLLNLPVSIEVDALNRALGHSERWAKAFNGAGKNTVRIHLHWPDTQDSTVAGPRWWETTEPFRVLGVDLGQRHAAAAAVIQVEPEGKGPWFLGQAGGHEWCGRLESTRLLKLPGEDAQVIREGVFVEEWYGSSGRNPVGPETGEAMDMIRRLGMDPDLWSMERLSFPEQNDKLLVALRRAQKRLAECHRWAWMLGEEDRRAKGLEELRSQEVWPDWAVLAGEGSVEPLRAAITEEAERLRNLIPRELTRLADRILPLRQRRWAWIVHPSGSGTFQLVKGERRAGEPSPHIRGQRGLSMARLEQLEELRKRCQALNRVLQRQVGQEPIRLSEMRNRPVPDPCPDLLDKLDEIRIQRVNQTAHLIVVEALGLKLRAPSAPPKERLSEDRHGEYERTRSPVDFVVLEDLSRYLTSQGRAPRENSRLMKWSHRAILDKVKQLLEPFGIPVLETPAAYSSLFCSRSGVAGFRAVEVGLKDLKRFPRWTRHLAPDKEGIKPSEETLLVREVYGQLQQAEATRQDTESRVPRTLLLPIPGGPIFVPADAATRDKAHTTQADLNAAINLALRAVASPQAWSIRNKVRAKWAKDAWVPVIGNKVEKARFRGSERFEPTRESDTRDRKRQVNLFVDVGQVAVFGVVKAPPGLPRLATGQGLWGSVKQAQTAAVRALNQRRLAKWEQDALPPVEEMPF